MAPIDGRVALVGIHPFVVVPSVLRIVIIGQTVKGRSTRAIAFVQHASNISVVFAQSELLAVHTLGQGINAHIFVVDEQVGIHHADAWQSIRLTLCVRQLVHLHPKFVGHLVAKTERLCPHGFQIPIVIAAQTQKSGVGHHRSRFIRP